MRRIAWLSCLVLAAACGSGSHGGSSSGAAAGTGSHSSAGSSAVATSSGSGSPTSSSGTASSATTTGAASSGASSSGTPASSSGAPSISSSGAPSTATATATSSSSGTTTAASSSSSSGSSGVDAGCGPDGTACNYQDEGSGSGTCCSGVCQYDLEENPAYCGSCGNACPGDDFCFSGQCYPYTCDDSGYCFVSDGGYQGLCCGAGDLTCVDPSQDSANCGSCGHACGSGQACINTQCLATDCTVPSNVAQECPVSDGGAYGTCCDGICTPYTGDCLACGEVCPSGSSCGTNSYCTETDGGYSYCSGLDAQPCPGGTACGQDGKCVLLPSGCGTSTLGSICAGGGTEDRCCGTACVDFYYDNSNCGGCGSICGSGDWCYEGQCIAVPSCTAANSGTACPVDAGEPGLCCSGACTDPHSDSLNCGTCGAECPVGQVCNGSCELLDGGYGGCYGATCPAGTLCSENGCYAPACAPGSTGVACAFGEPNDGSDTGVCCNGSCVDVTQDPNNCGRCGTACASGICTGNFPFGGGQCTADLADAGPYDGGIFGFDCAIFGCQEPGLTCINHQCVSATCQFGGFSQICLTASEVEGTCCSNEFTQSSTCHDLTSEDANCGACGWTCPTGSTCVNGDCSGVAAACGTGHHGEFCDLDAGGTSVCCASGCADLRTDNANCGGCNNTCYDGLTCVSGLCTALTCTTSTQEQPCPEADGGGTGECCSTACVDPYTDPLNCGACAYHCPDGDTCVAGSCGVPSCGVEQTGDACHLPSGAVGECCNSGCVDTLSDPNNCGGCNQMCTGGDGGCVQGGCN